MPKTPGCAPECSQQPFFLQVSTAISSINSVFESRNWLCRFWILTILQKFSELRFSITASPVTPKSHKPLQPTQQQWQRNARPTTERYLNISYLFFCHYIHVWHILFKLCSYCQGGKCSQYDQSSRDINTNKNTINHQVLWKGSESDRATEIPGGGRAPAYVTFAVKLSVKAPVNLVPASRQIGVIHIYNFSFFRTPWDATQQWWFAISCAVYFNTAK